MTATLNGSPIRDITLKFSETSGLSSWYNIDYVDFIYGEKDLREKITQENVVRVITSPNPMTFDYVNEPIFSDETVLYNHIQVSQTNHLPLSSADMTELKTGFEIEDTALFYDMTFIFNEKVTIQPEGNILFLLGDNNNLASSRT